MVKWNNQSAAYWRIAWPAALEGLLIVLLSSIDLLMISSLGAEAVAAVGIFSQPKMVILCVSRSMAVAVTATIALGYGKGERQELAIFTKQMTTLILVVSIIIFAVTSLYMKQVLILAGAQATYMEEAMAYSFITNVSLVFQAVAIVLNSALTGLGRTRDMLFANVSGNIGNVVFNSLFIYSFNWGVKGAALATVIGSIITLVCSIYFVCLKESLINVKGWANWLPTKQTLHTIMCIFKGAFVEQGCERVGMFLYSYFVAQLGVISFSTHCICMTLCDIFYNFGQGFSKASLALAAQSVGKCEEHNIRRLMVSATPLCFMWATLAAGTYFLGRMPIMGIYSHQPEVISLGSSILVFVAICCYPQTLSLCYSGLLRGLGYTSYVAKYSFWSIAVIRPIVTFTLIFILRMDLYGAWLALLFDQFLRMSCATKKLLNVK